MKIKPEHYETLKTAMLAVPANGSWITGTLAECRQQYIDTGMTYGRWVFDWMNAAKFELNGEQGVAACHWICKTLYPYGLHDSHILTAIRKIDKDEFGAWTREDTRTVNGKKY